jgi:dTDP-4-amino-4,6-dideoxygalactose transaminase
MTEQQAFERLEDEYDCAYGVPSGCCVAVSSGTSALHIACEVLRASHGYGRMRICVPDYTMVAVPRAVSMADCDPVFVDVHESDFTMDLRKLPPVYDALMLVDTYGCSHWYDPKDSPLNEVPFIQDLSEAHGTQPDKRCFAACWSFYKNKIVHGEEGGMIMFRDPEHGRLARMLRSIGFTDAHDYTHIPRGVNARMSNLHAAPILQSFYQLETNSNHRLDIALDYDRVFCADGVGLTTDVNAGNMRACISTSNWVYPVRVVGMTYQQQNEVVRTLQSKNIAARHGFKPMSSQQEYFDPYYRAKNTVTYKVAPEVFYLPITETMTASEALLIGELTMALIKRIVKGTVDNI